MVYKAHSSTLLSAAASTSPLLLFLKNLSPSFLCRGTWMCVQCWSWCLQRQTDSSSLTCVTKLSLLTITDCITSRYLFRSSATSQNIFNSMYFRVLHMSKYLCLESFPSQASVCMPKTWLIFSASHPFYSFFVHLIAVFSILTHFWLFHLLVEDFKQLSSISCTSALFCSILTPFKYCCFLLVVLHWVHYSSNLPFNAKQTGNFHSSG